MWAEAKAQAGAGESSSSHRRSSLGPFMAQAWSLEAWEAQAGMAPIYATTQAELLLLPFLLPPRVA